MRFRLIYYKNGEQFLAGRMIIAGFLSVLSVSIIAVTMWKYGNTMSRDHTC